MAKLIKNDSIPADLLFHRLSIGSPIPDGFVDGVGYVSSELVVKTSVRPQFPNQSRLGFAGRGAFVVPKLLPVIVPWTDSRLAGVTESDILKLIRQKNPDGSLRVNLGNNKIVTLSPNSFVNVRIDEENFYGEQKKIVNIIAHDNNPETKATYTSKIPLNFIMDALKEDHSTIPLPSGDGVPLPPDTYPAYGYSPLGLDDYAKLVAYLGLALSTGQMVTYDEFLQIFRGKNGKFYNFSHGRNQYTGKLSDAEARYKILGKLSRRIFYISAGLTITQIIRKETSIGWGLSEIGSSAIETFSSPSIGIAWWFGWDLLGRNIASMDSYQRFKFNFWYNYWESQVGPPNDYNKELWRYFYENYQF